MVVGGLAYTAPSCKKVYEEGQLSMGKVLGLLALVVGALTLACQEPAPAPPPTPGFNAGQGHSKYPCNRGGVG